MANPTGESRESKDTGDTVIALELVDDTIAHFTALDRTGDQRTMRRMARRLGKEQPALLRHAAALKAEHGEDIGEAAVFYCTLVWAIFDRAFPRQVPRLTDDNIADATEVVERELGEVEDLAARPVHQRYAPARAETQPYIYKKLEQLLEEDVSEEAMTAECADIVFKPAQIMVEAFDAAIEGRRPGERHGPVVRQAPKVGRNEPCPCGSGKKYKKCCGRAA